MKLFFQVKITPHLLQEEISIRSFCEVSHEHITSTGFFQPDFEKFKNKFFTKYELEYGVNKENFIINEFEKYVRILEKALDDNSKQALRDFLKPRR